ncbi:MAG: flagellar basal body P-ring protein FlgI [Planctomycetes bacterium]|nr:flagellar basal body P-ring protein FlgI [Planctomycetota bacterium]
MRTTEQRCRHMRWTLAIVAWATTAGAAAEVRVQDIAHLQGQRTNRLLGYGLVVGLDGTGDGGKNEHTMRALMAIHRKFQQPVLSSEELKTANNVALVAIEATIPEFGAREGQVLDVAVSAFSAKSLKGGRLLTTPLQFAAFDENDPATQQILGFAGGWIDIPDSNVLTRGIIRGGCTLEEDFFYSFVLDGYVTLVLDDEHDGFPWAHLVARAINHESSNPAEVRASVRETREVGRVVVTSDVAEAIGPKNVRVRIPPYELASPAGFITRVLETHVFMTPKQPARVCINRTTGHVSFTGAVTISPTILQIPGLGTLAVGSPPSGPRGQAGEGDGEVAFQELLNTLSKLQLQPEQMVAAIEHLRQTETLHAQVVHTE